MSDYHTSVLLAESIEALKINPSGIYVDVTFGAGGHSKSILNSLGANGRLYGFDQDFDAFANQFNDERLTLIRSNFRYIKQWMRYHGESGIDGVLADLGVSSWQFDAAERGFSYRYDGPVDMRMNQASEKTAQHVLKYYDEKDLVRVFSDYGQVRNSKTLAARIVRERRSCDFGQMSELMTVLESIRIGDRNRYLAQVFQALRIEVNEELDALKEFLKDAIDLLNPGGRLVVISYHSLEDKFAKQAIAGKYHTQQDEYGRQTVMMKKVGKGLVLPSESEMELNSRSKSAKMRIAEKQAIYERRSK